MCMKNSYKSIMALIFLLVIVAVVCISALYELSRLNAEDGFAALV